MSPRGVVIPEIRKQLFDAAERVLLRDGPAGLTGRAITREAGCATGLLYNHFGDLDAFLVALFLDRAHHAASGLADLPDRAGTGTVVDNLMAAIGHLLEANLLALGALTLSRPSMVTRLGEAIGDGTLAVDASERAFASYLESEKEQGRITADADTESLALALVGAAHQLLLTRGPQAPGLRDRLVRVATVLIDGVTP